MATLRQKRLQAPLLLDIATRPNGITANKSGSDWKEVADGHFEKYSKAWGEECSWDKLKNDAQYARLQLKKHGCLSGKSRQYWRVSEDGLERLRLLVLKCFEELPEAELARIASTKYDSRNEFFILVLRALDESALRKLVQSTYSTAGLLTRGLQLVPVESLSSILTDCYEDLLEVFSEQRRLLAEMAVS